MRSLQEVQKDYADIMKLPSNADAAAKRSRGYAFERLLKRLFELDHLEPRGGYKLSGEQIDGSIYLDGRVYLMEAKWHTDPLPASTLYEFKGKVDGKLAGTLGIFISMSGYSKDAVDALALGKRLDIILVDRNDIDAAIVRGFGIKTILKLKLRMAAEEGAIYYPFEGDLVTAKETSFVEIDSFQYDITTGDVVASQPVTRATGDLLVVCEGDTDRVIIAELCKRLLEKASSSRSIKILTAMGKMTIPRVAKAFWSTVHSESKLLIVTDGDNDPVGTYDMLSKRLDFAEWVAAIPNPSIEAWLGLDGTALRRQSPMVRAEQFRQAVQQLDIDALKARDEQFRRFCDAVLGNDA